jgi:hypothetical protein
MSIDTATIALNELHDVIARVQAGVRDPDAAKKALERMDRMREELRQKIGTVDMAVELIRDARDQ